MNVELTKTEETRNVDEENIADTSEETSTEEETETDQTSSDEDTTDGEDETTTDGDETDQTSDTDQTDKTGVDETQAKEEKMRYAFKKKSHQLQEQKLKTQQANEKARLAEEKLSELTKPKRPAIPELPDSFDPEYASKMQIRDSAILAQAKYDEDAKQQLKVAETANQQVIDNRLAEVKTKQDMFIKNRDSFGIDEKTMLESEDVLTPYINQQTAPTVEFILEHEVGPLIVQELAEDPVELDKVIKMAPMQAAVYIQNTLAPKASKRKPATTKTPAPLKTVEKKGAVKTESHYLKGAKFE